MDIAALPWFHVEHNGGVVPTRKFHVRTALGWRARPITIAVRIPSLPVEAVCPSRESSVSECPRWTRSIACRRFRRLRPKCWPRVYRMRRRHGGQRKRCRGAPRRRCPLLGTRRGGCAWATGFSPSSPSTAWMSASVRRIAGCVSPSAAILVDDQGERLVCAYNDPGPRCRRVVAAARHLGAMPRGARRRALAGGCRRPRSQRPLVMAS
mgnify:CR=1 FL=1